jgi:ribonuclease P protein component
MPRPGERPAAMRRVDFLRVTGAGRRVATDYFTVFVHERTGEDGGARLGITVTRKVGNAVRRNRIKRLVREWFRQRRSALGRCDLVVIAKRDIPERLGLSEVARDLDRSLGSSSRGSGSTG